jgi:hypothetical protein
VNQFIREKVCEHCPFSETPGGIAMRESLAPGRVDSIKADLDKGKSFPCHESYHAVKRKRDALICAGALAYQRQNGCVPDAVQVMERLIALREGRKPRW